MLSSAPILKMVVLISIVAALIVLINHLFVSLPSEHILVRESFWILPHLVHLPQFLLPFLVILFVSRGRPADYGFNLGQDPPTFTHARMLALGIVAGLFLSVGHFVRLFSGLPVDVPQPVSVSSVVGSLAFQWIVVGLAEETMFRGMIQTYLMKTLKGSTHLAGHDFHVGTVAAALLWGVFHLINVLVMPFLNALFTAVITTFAGLLMGYAYQRTRSLLTTILVHNALFGVPLTIGYLIYALI